MTASHRVRRGFSLVELLVVMALVSALLALLLPAVQSARDASRRLGCQNNLHQIGIALHNFEANVGHYPLRTPASASSTPPRLNNLSPLGQLAPFLIGDEGTNVLVSLRSSAHQAATPVAPPVCHCPADPLASGEATNYRFNLGILGRQGLSNGIFLLGNRPCRSRDIADGLSGTAFVSERFVHRGNDARAPAPTALLELPSLPGAFAALDCLAANRDGTAPISSNSAGTDWMNASHIDALYVHLLPPNAAWRDCDLPQNLSAFVNARSWHRNGVNVLAGDGAVRGVSDDVDLGIWRAAAEIADRQRSNWGDQP